MALKRRMWFWLLLLLILIPCILWRGALRRSNEPIEHIAIPAPRQHRSAQEDLAQGGGLVPVYVPSSVARLSEYHRPAEYLLTGTVTSEQGEALPGAIVSLHETGMSRVTYDWPPPFLYQDMRQ